MGALRLSSSSSSKVSPLKGADINTQAPKHCVSQPLREIYLPLTVVPCCQRAPSGHCSYCCSCRGATAHRRRLLLATRSTSSTGGRPECSRRSVRQPVLWATEAGFPLTPHGRPLAPLAATFFFLSPADPIVGRLFARWRVSLDLCMVLVGSW